MDYKLAVREKLKENKVTDSFNLLKENKRFNINESTCIRMRVLDTDMYISAKEYSLIKRKFSKLSSDDVYVDIFKEDDNIYIYIIGRITKEVDEKLYNIENKINDYLNGGKYIFYLSKYLTYITT